MYWTSSIVSILNFNNRVKISENMRVLPFLVKFLKGIARQNMRKNESRDLDVFGVVSH